VTKAIRVFIAGLFLGTALFAGAQDVVRVQVPFDFHVGGQALPSGTYTVRRVFDRDTALLQISGGHGQESATFLTNLADATHYGAGLSFRRYGDSYYLSGVTNATGKFNLRRSKEERMLSMKGSGDEVVVGGSQ